MAKTTKRALILSVLAVVMCVAMLVGTTFAWFTDSASTGLNKIVAGNLDVQLEYSKNFSEWKKVDSTTKVFEDSTLWEPGHTEVVYLRVKNAGTLALKYTLGLGNVYESAGRNVANEQYFLSNYVKMGALEADAAYANRTEAIDAVEPVADTIKAIGEKGVVGATLNAGEDKTYAMVIYMPTEVGNEANPKNKDPYWAGKLSFGVSVNASQATVESDSFDNTYDKNAAAIIDAVSFSSGTHEVNENIQASSTMGAVQAEGTAKVTINADVYAVYTTGGKDGNVAIAVEAGENSTVTINGGDFRQVGVPADDPCDLIYATDSGTIVINGGTFKAVTPENTLNVLDANRGTAKIIVNGGRFYKYDPSNPTLGDNEIFLGEGCKVTQDGDWFVVSK